MTRIQTAIIERLKEGEATVQDLIRATKASPSAVKENMFRLAYDDVVTFRREIQIKRGIQGRKHKTEVIVVKLNEDVSETSSMVKVSA